VAFVPALLLSVRKASRGPAGFASAMALVYVVFIAFNKQAFCNYYFFVIGCFCCAIAAAAGVQKPGWISAAKKSRDQRHRV
jgi:hypothetical protein